MTPGQNGPSWWDQAFSHNPNAAFAFDVWATHPYPESYPPHYNHHDGVPYRNQVKTIDSYLLDLDLVAQYGRRGFPVMITETAYGDHLGISYEGYPKTTRSMAADYNVAAFGQYLVQVAGGRRGPPVHPQQLVMGGIRLGPWRQRVRR